MFFTDENPPKLTESQAREILSLVQAGETIQSITLHPYSGAATVGTSWKRSGGDTVAIIPQAQVHTETILGQTFRVTR